MLFLCYFFTVAKKNEFAYSHTFVLLVQYILSLKKSLVKDTCNVFYLCNRNKSYTCQEEEKTWGQGTGKNRLENLFTKCTRDSLNQKGDPGCHELCAEDSECCAVYDEVLKQI